MAKPAKKAAKKSAAKKPAAKKPAKPKAKKAAAKKPAASHKAVAVNKERFTLHGYALSMPTYKVALALSLMRHPFSYIHINLREGAHKQPDYLVKNRFGQVPCLRDGHVFLCQSAAILEHLADSLHKFDGKTPVEQQRIKEWLFWIWDRLAAPISRLRARARGFRQFGDEVRVMYQEEARNSLHVLDHEFAKNEWLVGKKPTIADIDIYGVIRYAPEAGIDLSPYPKLLAWKKRFEELPGFATPEHVLPMESRLL